MVIGIDEVGRGCWAGPLVASAVALPNDHGIIGLNDSKKLSSKKRLIIVDQLKKSYYSIGIGWVWPREINKIGLTKAVQLAMSRAISEIDHNNVPIIIDGHLNYLQSLLCRDNPCCKESPCKICMQISTVVGGDGIVPAISAASIVAKVTRDEYMKGIAKKYPRYGFEKNVGYGTAKHIAALESNGITPIHRLKYKPIIKIMKEFEGAL